MAAQTLNCPMCGASASSEAHRCLHCGARLATVACDACFGMVFRGSKFCSHCGNRIREVTSTEAGHQCPRCRVSMHLVELGETQLIECPRCSGVWADVHALEKIRTDREQQAACLGAAVPLPETRSNWEKEIRYIPCPVCHKLMNRVNFARCSNVIVDVCKGHGTWFDRDELRKIVEFIQAGGLDTARQREVDELRAERRGLTSEKVTSSRLGVEGYPDRHWELDFGIGSVAKLLTTFFK